MPRQLPRETPAGFLRRKGWDDRIVLRGMPIIRDGKQIERGITLVVNAVGDNAVLAIGTVDGERPSREAMWTFDSRDWYVNGQEPQDARL